MPPTDEEPEHVDRQPPRDAEEAREQDRLIEEGAREAATEVATEAPDPDLA
jgi:hypothetical protein